MGQQILVTGAAGFIGSHVVKALLNENCQVRALVRPGENTANLDGLDIDIMPGDILDLVAVERATKGVDTVFHLAAIYAIWMKDWRNIYEVNIQGSRNVLWAALKAGVNRVVYTSSIAAIGIAPGKGLSTEKTPFNNYALGHHYVLTKYLSQQEALGFAANGLDLVVVNPCFPFGENDIGPTPTGKLIVDILKGITRIHYAGGINLIDVRDLAKGHLLAAKKGKTGEIYILGNENLTIGSFIKKVNALAGFPERKVPKLPRSVAKAGTSVLTWWSDHVSGKPPMSTPKEIAYSSQYLWFDNTKAKTELGLTLNPIDQALQESIDWFRRKGYV
jgi:dihydroflavonol-4-reductase